MLAKAGILFLLSHLKTSEILALVKKNAYGCIMTEPFLCPLEHRGVLRISGKDRRTFLQGLISNDIQLCQPGQPIYAALLTAQGKFLHDMFIVDHDDSLMIDCERARADDLVKRLLTYKLRADIIIENLNHDFTIWAFNETHASLPHAYADPRHKELGFRVMISAAEIDMMKTLSPAAADFSVYDRHRLQLGIADGSRDMIIGKSTLLECNLDRFNAISWTKGCYMGQELTARMHYRALVKKRLYPVRLTCPAPAFESLIYLDAQEAGDMRSSCGDVGLALLNIEKAEKQDPVMLRAENFVAP